MSQFSLILNTYNIMLSLNYKASPTFGYQIRMSGVKMSSTINENIHESFQIDDYEIATLSEEETINLINEQMVLIESLEGDFVFIDVDGEFWANINGAPQLYNPFTGVFSTKVSLTRHTMASVVEDYGPLQYFDTLKDFLETPPFSPY